MCVSSSELPTPLAQQSLVPLRCATGDVDSSHPLRDGEIRKGFYSERASLPKDCPMGWSGNYLGALVEHCDVGAVPRHPSRTAPSSFPEEAPSARPPPPHRRALGGRRVHSWGSEGGCRRPPAHRAPPGKGRGGRCGPSPLPPQRPGVCVLWAHLGGCSSGLGDGVPTHQTVCPLSGGPPPMEQPPPQMRPERAAV